MNRRGIHAAGFARASGRVGVDAGDVGPERPTWSRRVRDCMADSVPTVVICGQVPTTAIGTDAFQEAPVPSIMVPSPKARFPDHRSDQLEATVRTGVRDRPHGAAPGRWLGLDVPRTCSTGRRSSTASGRLPVRVSGRDEFARAEVKCPRRRPPISSPLSAPRNARLIIGRRRHQRQAAHACGSFTASFSAGGSHPVGMGGRGYDAGAVDAACWQSHGRAFAKLRRR